MADVFGPNWLPASHLTGEIEQPTDAKSLMAPYTGDPQQMYQFLMDPKNQEQMSQFGVHFNPQTIHESPFFSQHFMQQHPQLGGRLSAGMASMAATPEAPMVSGAGSGIQRAMQGAMGGPQMLRQYQSNQLMGPMQQMGMQIPQMEFGRKQQLLGGMLGMMSSDEDATRAAQAEKARTDQANEQLKQEGEQRKIESLNPKPPVFGMSSEGKPGAWTNTPPKLGQTANPREYSNPIMGPMFAGQGSPISTPDQPGSWNFQEGASAGRQPAQPGLAGVQGRQGAAGAAYQQKLAAYEDWISKVQGDRVPVIGQEGSTAQPARYWSQLNPQEQQTFIQQQQQLKQQFENEYTQRYESAGGGPKPGGAFNYAQQQPLSGKPQPQQPQAPTNFNKPPESPMMNPGGAADQNDPYAGLPPQAIQFLQQNGY